MLPRISYVQPVTVAGEVIGWYVVLPGTQDTHLYVSATPA